MKSEKGVESLLKQTVVENFPNLGRHLDIQVPKTHRPANKLKEILSRHIIIKIKHKEWILKAAKEVCNLKGNLYETISEFLSKDLAGQGGVWWHIPSAERKKTCQPRILKSSKAVLQKWETKTFPDRPQLRKFITTRPSLQEMLKGVFKLKWKDTN